MAFSRYSNDRIQSSAHALRTTMSIAKIRSGIRFGTIPVVYNIVTTQGDRLDTLSGEYYGDAGYWWVLAAASNIGWAIQVPPGTNIIVPDLKYIERILG